MTKMDDHILILDDNTRETQISLPGLSFRMTNLGPDTVVLGQKPTDDDKYNKGGMTFITARAKIMLAEKSNFAVVRLEEISSVGGG